MAKKKPTKRRRRDEDDDAQRVVEPNEATPPDPEVVELAQRLLRLGSRDENRLHRRASAFLANMARQFEILQRHRGDRVIAAALLAATALAGTASEGPRVHLTIDQFMKMKAAELGRPIGDEEEFELINEWELLYGEDAEPAKPVAPVKVEVTDLATTDDAPASTLEQRYREAHQLADGLIMGELDIAACTAVADAYVALRLLFVEEGLSAEELTSLTGGNW